MGQQADEVIDLSSTDTDSSSASSVSSTLSLPPTVAAPKPARYKFSPALARLLVYTIGVKYRGFNKKEVYPASNMISLSERTANKVLKQGFGDVIKHNRTHLMRLYPNVTRLTSSNYDPTRYWAAGAQLVAINWQSTGASHPSLSVPRPGRADLPAVTRRTGRLGLRAQRRHVLAQRPERLRPQAGEPPLQEQGGAEHGREPHARRPGPSCPALCPDSRHTQLT